MPFNIALSGIRAANSELEITGNNIANASTTGFKNSRAEFGDVYATSVLGAGTNQIGAGVEIQGITQQFSQGNITFTENALDMAINGNGFFILNDAQGGGRTYTRAGTFGLDASGYIVANNNSRLQGYSADTAGNIDNVLGDLRVEASTIDPRQTTAIDQRLNLPATTTVLPGSGRQFTTAGPQIGVAVAGVGNGYAAQAIDITSPQGNTTTYTSATGASASSIASELNAILGLSALAETSANLSNFNGAGGALTVTINNVALSVNSLAELENEINIRSNSTLPGVSATLDTGTGTLSVDSVTGSDLVVTVAGNAGAGLDIQGINGAAQSLSVGGAAQSATVGGFLTVVVDDGYIVSNESPSGTGILQALGDITDPANAQFTDVETNSFDPNDPGTYNSATSTTIYDSLGAQHVMTQYFVKQPFNPNDPTSANHWVMHVQIDGQDVGDPDPASTTPGLATPASFNVYFNANGSLDETRTNTFLITNWNVLTSEGLPSGALGPNVGAGLPLPEPPTSSNFSISLTNSTQFGTPFAVNSIDQNGYTAGQLSGLVVDKSGVIFARFTNGESLALGQVLMADFANQQGLQPIGNTAWAETFESGDPVINEPGTASLGAIQSGALEESNVDLSEQLVQLIISQRNFQASAKTIETADQTTQTIINLR